MLVALVLHVRALITALILWGASELFRRRGMKPYKEVRLVDISMLSLFRLAWAFYLLQRCHAFPVLVAHYQTCKSEVS